LEHGNYPRWQTMGMTTRLYRFVGPYPDDDASRVRTGSRHGKHSRETDSPSAAREAPNGEKSEANKDKAMTAYTKSTPTLLLTAKEAAAALRISPKSLWANSQPRGDIPVVRIGRSVRYSVASLQQWIAAQEAAVADGAKPIH